MQGQVVCPFNFALRKLLGSKPLSLEVRFVLCPLPAFVSYADTLLPRFGASAS